MCQQVALHSFIQARCLLDKSQRSFRSLQAASSPFLVLLSLKSRDPSHPLAATVSFLEYSSSLPLSDLFRLSPSSAMSGTLNSLPSGRVFFVHSLSNASSDVDATVGALQAVASEVAGGSVSSDCQSLRPNHTSCSQSSVREVASTRPVPSSTQSRYPSSRSQYPSAQSNYPSSRSQCPSSQSQHPSSQPQYPSAQSQYPSSRSQYPSAHATNHFTSQSPTISTHSPTISTHSPTISTHSPTVTRLPCGPTLTHTLKAAVCPETLDWRRLPLCAHCMNHCDTIESAVRDTVVAVGSRSRVNA